MASARRKKMARVETFAFVVGMALTSFITLVALPFA
jgi:hypothetical protein